MKIEKLCAVTLNYVARDGSGEVIDSSEVDGPIRYIHGTQDLIPGLETRLAGRELGEKLNVDIPMDEAYGPRDETMVEDVPRANFPGISDITPGMQFQTEMDDGSPMVVTVVAVTDDTVTVDGNHPLAGKDLAFELEIIEVRHATAEEIEHGHVHDSQESCQLH